MKVFGILTCLFVICAFSAAKAEDDCRLKHPEWTICRANADCVLVEDMCGFPTDGVSKSHEKEARSCNEAKAAHTQCLRGYDPKIDGPWRAVCNDGECASAQIVK